MDEKGYCFVSQEIRDSISNDIIIVQDRKDRDETGKFLSENLEKRVQPASFEPSMGEEVFVLDTEENGVFLPGKDDSVYKALLRLPKRQRQRFSLLDGFELKAGFTYLVPLQEKINLDHDERIRSSPKSSIGRLFPKTRMVSDYIPSFDNIHDVGGKIIQPWLLIQPTSFNLIAWPGLSLNQLRIHKGYDVSLSQIELMKEFEKTPLLYRKKGDEVEPMKAVIGDDGLQINIDLIGNNTNNIVALRARKNPNPIDLSKIGEYDAEDYFEPISTRHGKLILFGGERYLIASDGILYVPPHLSAELRRHSGVTIRADWDEAGFADNGFRGDLVCEATINEKGRVNIEVEKQQIPVSHIEFFRTRQIPDKIYGQNIGSNYQGQLGARVSKHFKKFDFGRAAKDYKKLDRDVLVIDSHEVLKFRRSREGFERIEDCNQKELLKAIRYEGFFHSRYDCEDDESILQPIPYLLIFDKEGKIFTYQRTSDIKDYGDSRLFDKYSIGIGGHIGRDDSPDYIMTGLLRERSEEVEIIGNCSDPVFVGTLMAYDKPVDRVHFGIIYKVNIDGQVEPIERSITSAGMRSIESLIENKDLNFETWSRMLLPHLDSIRKYEL